MEPLPILDIFWRPALASAVMAAVLYVLIPQNIILALIVGSLAYGVVLFLAGALGADEWMLVQKLVPKRFERVMVMLSRGALVAEGGKQKS